jgi:hypothetical protein
MKAPVLVALFAALVVGFGVAALALGGREGSASDSAAAERLARIEAELDSIQSLADAMEQLQARLDLVEATAINNAARTPALPAPPAPSASLEAAAAPSGDAIPVPPVVDDRLRLAISRVLQEEREAAERLEEQRREQRRLEQMERRLDRLSTDLALDARQKEELRAVLFEDDRRRQEMRERFERGEVDWADEGFRAELNEYVAARDQRLASFLTPEQLESYRQTPEGRITGFLRRGLGGFGGGDARGVFGDRRRDREGPPR